MLIWFLSVDSVQTALRDAISSISTSKQYLNLPSLQQLPAFLSGGKIQNGNSEGEVVITQDTEEDKETCSDSVDSNVDDVMDEDESQRLNFLRINCDRLTERRATDFSQVNKHTFQCL